MVSWCELVASPGSAITSFTQQQITDGNVQFVHDGGESAPAYSITVSDGSMTDGPSVASISFSNANDAPALVNNSLTINEGETIVLSGADLSATDIDNADNALAFTVSGVTNGQFELVASPGSEITSFTQQQITDGDMQFVHDGGESAPAYSVTVSDGSLIDGPSAASVTFSNVNDAPVLVNNALTISEGGMVILDGATLSATDVDTAANTLEFTTSSISDGQFELVASPGSAITSFTQQQITDGDVQFVHDGGESAPAYSITVSDGSLTDGPSVASISFSNANDAPALVNKSLTINEGETVVLSGADLSATDIDNADNALAFTVSGATNGQFELVASPGLEITSFTQQQITDGNVQFVHDGGESAPAYSITVSDGSMTDGPSVASISFSNANDAPALVNNSLTINEGETIVLSGADLSATDIDNADNTLAFTVSGVTNGQFELVASSGLEITSFTQQQITDGNVQFVHDGGESAPAYSISVSDGSLNDGPSAATISFSNANDAPVLVNNSLTISEGQTVILNGTTLSATDLDNADSSLTFSASGVNGGQFELVTSSGLEISSFTQQQVTDGDVQFVHDGGESAPAYSISVSDGSLTDGPSAATISFSNANDAPVLANNALTISEGGTVILDGSDLSATDLDNADSSLTFSASGVNGGQFELVASPGTAITSFTQQQITDGNVQFVHDGGESAPAYSITVSDSSLTDGPSVATISFSNANDAPVLANNSLTISEGQTVILNGTTLSATDLDNADSSLTFSASGVNGGQFELVASSGLEISSFTQQQVTDGDVQFVHDGGESAPAYSISVSDGSLTDGPSLATISFSNANDAPVLVNNALTISEGGTVILDGSDLSATDLDNADSSLIFSASGVNGGQFELVASPGTAITSFTQQQITDGNVQFVHDGGESAPAYSISVSDGSLNDGPSATTISFSNVNDAPVLVNNALTISEGGMVILDGATLSATDVDTAANTLEFTTSSISDGQFELVASPGSAITSFTQQQVTDGNVQFVHDGGETAPAYSITISDGSLSDGPSSASISFSNVNDAPLLTSEGGSAIASVSLAENQAAVTTVTSTDTDDGDSVTYSIAGGLDATQFSIDSDTGVLSFGTAPDFENPSDNNADNTYIVIVQITDRAGAIDTQTINIDITDLNDEAPLINSPNTLSVVENSAAVLTVTSSDDDFGDAVSYSISGGADAERFTVDTITGTLTFTTAPDFERPMDTGVDNIYEVTVLATDTNGQTHARMFSIRVINENERPEAAASRIDSSTGFSGVIGKLDISDPDTGDLVQVAIIGGTAPEAFSIDSDTGEVSLNADADLDPGRYLLEVGITDTQGASTIVVVQIQLLDNTVSPVAAIPDVLEFEPITSIDPLLPDSDKSQIQTLNLSNANQQDEFTGTSLPALVSLLGQSDQSSEESTDANLVSNASVFNFDNVYSLSLLDMPGNLLLSAQNVDADQGENHLLPNTVATNPFGSSMSNAEFLNTSEGFLSPQLLQAMDYLATELDQIAELSAAQERDFFTAGTVLSLSLSAGYVSWLMSGGYLTATAVSTAPLWRRFDPIPVLDESMDDSPQEQHRKSSLGP